MKKIAILIFLLPAMVSFSQSSFSVLSLKAGGSYGYTIGKVNNLKRLMLARGSEFTVEKNLKAGLYVTFGLEVLSLKFNYINGNNISGFSNNNFMLLPVTIKKYSIISKRSHLFCDIGVAPAWYFKKQEDFENGNAVSKKNVGFNFGITADAGFKTAINQKLSFSVGLTGFQSFFYFYKNNNDKLMVNSNCINTAFYWDIK